jgi:hypothetical protein
MCKIDDKFPEIKKWVEGVARKVYENGEWVHIVFNIEGFTFYIRYEPNVGRMVWVTKEGTALTVDEELFTMIAKICGYVCTKNKEDKCQK